MAKLPVAGRVKTRLAREIGVVQATTFYRVAACNLISRLARAPFWTTMIAVSPDRERDTPMLPMGVARMAQGGGDLGRRMQRPMRMLPPGPVCVIGTDVPDISVSVLRRAFQLLGRHDVVFGPAEDGGFWLIGMRRRPRVVPEPYRGVAWSRPDTLARVLANLTAARVAFTKTLCDVDCAGDLAANAGRYARRVPFRKE